MGKRQQAADRARRPGPGTPTRARTRTGSSAREKPSARRVPISRVRAATIAYIVFMAPNTAPMPMMMADERGQPCAGSRPAAPPGPRSTCAPARPAAASAAARGSSGRAPGCPSGPSCAPPASSSRRRAGRWRRSRRSRPRSRSRSAPPCRGEDADDLELLALVLDGAAQARGPGCGPASFSPTITSSRPGRELAALARCRCRRAPRRPWAVTPRRVTLVGCAVLLGQVDHDHPLPARPGAGRRRRARRGRPR